jgi:hypothetical protein
MEGRFDGGEVSGDGGLSVMREADQRLGLLKSVAARMGDGRQKGKVRHETATLLLQRVMRLCAGWEDLNDAGEHGAGSRASVGVGSAGAWQCADLVALPFGRESAERPNAYLN